MSDGVWLPQEEFDALVEKLRQHEVSLDAAMQRATRRVEQAEEAERDAVRAAVEWGDRVKKHAEALREIRDREPDRSSTDQHAFFWTWAKQVARAALDEEQG